MKLRRFVQAGLIVLIAVMPFHAFLSVWLGSLFGHQSLIQAWKEILSLLLLVATGILAVQQPAVRKQINNPITWLTLGYLAVSITVTLAERPDTLSAVFGLKTNFEYLILFTIALAVGTTKLLKIGVITTFITTFVTGIFAAVHSFFLPPDILTHFGYGLTTIWPYHLVDPALDAIRSPSTLGGPNQLGAFMLVGLGLGIAALLWRRRAWHVAVIIAGGLGVFVSYSRAALLGAVAVVIAVILLRVPSRYLLRTVGATGAAIILLGIIVTAGMSQNGDLQYYVLHTQAGSTDINNSTSQHSIALQNGVHLITQDPLGYGLGSAGPASFASKAGLIPENYYLQIGIEAGIIGLILFICINLYIARELLLRARTNFAATGLFAALIGISIVNLFLHGWADSTLAFIWWILAGVCVSSIPKLKDLKHA